MWGLKPKAVDAIEIITEPTSTGVKIIENPLKKCCHCGSFWRTREGSGEIRGKCYYCNDFFCGPKCQTCVPYEKQLEEESKYAQLYHDIIMGGGRC